MAGALLSPPDKPALPSPTISAEYAALQRILTSRHFTKAPLLSSFLTHVTRRTLDDGMVRISEHEIGVTVFQRSADFDPRQDNIVRTYARNLRKRLAEYYESDGESETIRIEIPKGTYVPIFRLCDPKTTANYAPALIEADTQPYRAASSTTSSWRRYTWHIAGAVLLLTTYSTALFNIARQTTPPRLANTHSSLLHPLWAELFQTDRSTLLVPADIGFVILQQSNHRSFSLAEYLSWFTSDHQINHLAMVYLKDQTYTSVLNMQIVSSLQRLPEAQPQPFTIRASKNITLDDLRDGNAILLGSSYSNPWGEIFTDKLNFHFVNHPEEDRFWIANEHPVGTEARIYESTTTNTTHKTYAVIAFVPNLNRTGHVLLLEGLDAAGTQAAADMLFDSNDLQPIIQAATNRQGSIESFELLIKVNSLDANSHPTSSQIVASRFYN